MRCVGSLPLLPTHLPLFDLSTLTFSELGTCSFFLLHINVRLLVISLFFLCRKSNAELVLEDTGRSSGKLSKYLDL